ncbi:Membrane associated serine protease, rhomboid family [Desulfuromusa kysingii]|uniref:Membrane associated serine protease, rhomboid family n=1 Tax=Desulfuromusa kysingii TaxID=37625 RepID=A0A1H3XLD2_9BACT|nr:rhomboid family intramembrane serine protease [Desulfuromusa kysingii]SEA00156.1 Membrane associated serine protease, rhomboid family [Desulfuromusa kysingii]
MTKERHIEIEQLDWLPIPPTLEDGLAEHAISKRQLKNWTLVLQSRQIPCRSEKVDNKWQLSVPVSHYQNALQELIQYETENQNWPPPPPAERTLHENTASTIWILILLAIFHNVTQHKINLFGHHPVDWFELGNAHAGKILNGEWWRLITALTLHSGFLHLFSNITLGGIFMVRLCRLLGSGRAWFLVLCAGSLGNFLNALVQSSDHRSIGASTAVFGAVGLLATINMLHFRSTLRKNWPLPIAAALGLLALLGASGENTDIGAHLFGFISGSGLGFMSNFFTQHVKWSWKQIDRKLALCSACMILGAWGLALTANL